MSKNCRLQDLDLHIMNFCCYNSGIREKEGQSDRDLEKGAFSPPTPPPHKKHKSRAEKTIKETTTLFFSYIPGVSFFPKSGTQAYSVRWSMLPCYSSSQPWCC